MARKKSLRQIIEELTEDFIPIIRDAFLASIQDVVDNVVLKRVVDAIETGDVEAAFRALGFSNAAMRPLSKALEDAFEAGGVAVGKTFPRMRAVSDTVYRFDVRNSRAEAWLRDQSSRLITRVQNDAMDSVRNVLFDGMQAGRNPRSTALDIIGRVNPVTGRREGGIVGLTAPQERWVANARRELTGTIDPSYFNRKARFKKFDFIVNRAIKEGRPLTNDEIDKIIGKYKDNLLKLRGKTIARTESIQSLNRSEYEAFKQAVDQGAVAPSAVKRVWDSAGDDGRTRETHLEMDGQSVGLDDPFISPSGARLMFPGDTSLGAPAEETINCRCRVRLNVDWLADLD